MKERRIKMYVQSSGGKAKIIVLEMCSRINYWLIVPNLTLSVLLSKAKSKQKKQSCGSYLL